MKTTIVAFLASAFALTTPPQAKSLPTSRALEESFGAPMFSHEHKGVAFRVFAVGDLKVIAVNPPGSETPAFLSFVREGIPLSSDEIDQFLFNFATTAQTSWKIFDRSAPEQALKFFMSAPYANQSAANEMISRLPNPKAAAAAWETLARDPQARSEASSFLDMLKSQRQMWISEDGRYLATWSPDGTALGVGVIPPSAR